jgi:FAD/FMN-containing dehydrogenase
VIVTDQHQTTSVASVADDLAARIRGEVLTAGEGYDASRTPHFGFRTGRPVAVVRPSGADDVAVVVETAARSGLRLHVRGGGHHAAGHATGDGLLLDLGSLDDVTVESDSGGPGTLWAGGGASVGQVTAALADRGLAVGFGDAGSVGIGGLTLSGGIGFLSRRDGMTIDNLLGAEIVTADGRVRMVDAEHEPDLFWAIRGGGGNVGVVTRFRYRAVPTRQVYGGMLVLPATPDAVHRVYAACAAADDELTAIVSVMAMPPLETVPTHLHGHLVVMVRVCWSGHIDHLDQAERAVAPLRLAATPLIDALGPMPYADLFAQPAPNGGAVVAVRTMFRDSIGTAAAAAIVEHLGRSRASLRLVQFRVLGGAIARVDPAATAYAHRRSRVLVTIVSNDQPDLETARGWVEGLAAHLEQDDRGAYVGFFGPHDRHRISDAYPQETLARLRRIKASVDPDNLFRHNDNVVGQ